MFIMVPKEQIFSWAVQLCSWHVLGIWFLPGQGCCVESQWPRAAVPFVLVGESVALVVSAVVDPL